MRVDESVRQIFERDVHGCPAARLGKLERPQLDRQFRREVAVLRVLPPHVVAYQDDVEVGQPDIVQSDEIAEFIEHGDRQLDVEVRRHRGGRVAEPAGLQRLAEDLEVIEDRFRGGCGVRTEEVTGRLVPEQGDLL